MTGEGHSRLGKRVIISAQRDINTAKLVAALLMLMSDSPRLTPLLRIPKGRNGRRGAETSVAADATSIENPSKG